MIAEILAADDRRNRGARMIHLLALAGQLAAIEVRG